MISALTDDPPGNKLPSQAAPWRRDDRNIIDVGPTETPEFIASEVARDGYYLVVSAQSRTRKREIKRTAPLIQGAHGIR